MLTIEWSAQTVLLFCVVAAALSYTGLALWQVGRYRATRSQSPAFDVWPSISVLRPLCGAEPRLYESLRSFFVQDYQNYHMVFGVRDRFDPAIQVVEKLKREFPDSEAELVIDARIHGPNLKVSNLMNMMESCRHSLIVVADSDVLATPDTLRRMASLISGPDVGAVTSYYCGLGSGGLASRLGAMFINDWFLPSAMVDVSISGVDGCYGPLTAIRRSVLDEIGGYSALVNFLAEDNRMGRLVRSRNRILALDSFAVPTVVNAKRLSDLFRQELRWARTVRTCRPKDHFLSVITFPLPVMLGLAATSHTMAAFAAVAGYVGLRMALNATVSVKIPAVGRAAPLLVPVRECLCFLVWLVSLWGRKVVWRGREYRLVGDGRLEPTDPQIQPIARTLVSEESV